MDDRFLNFRRNSFFLRFFPLFITRNFDKLSLHLTDPFIWTDKISIFIFAR